MTVPTADLSAGAERTAHCRLVLPDRPDVEWLAVLVPIPRADLDDPTITARQVALDAALAARELAEPIVYAAVLERRADARP